MTREARNYQFDFLKPQHSNFGYFTKLVEQYTKILLPPKDLVEKLRRELHEPKNVLNAVKYRVEWERYQRRVREHEEAEVERERVAYAQIDWHDFVVVQTVDFQSHETANLPPPCTPKDVGARLLAQQRLEVTKSSAQTMEMEVESESEGESDHEQERTEEEQAKADKSLERQQAHQNEFEKLNQQEEEQPQLPPPPPIPAPPNPDDVIIRTDYNPRSKQLERIKQDQKWVISPLTGEKILADKLAEHMRFNTVDSQYFVQKERELHEKQDEEPVYAPGVDISANIVSFAERRSDIFGVGSRGAEQAMIGKKLGEENRPAKMDPKAVLDGHSPAVDSTNKGAQSQISIEQQIAQIHRSQGLLTDSEKERIGPKSGITDAQVPASTSSVTTTQGVVGSFVPQRMPFPGFGAPPGPPAPPRMPPAPFPTGPGDAQPPPAQGAPPAFFSGNGPVGPLPPHLPGSGPLHAPMGAGGVTDEDVGGPTAAKRTKTSEDQLTPEATWLATHGSKGPIAISVQCPVVSDKPEWNLNGQTVSFTMDLRENISGLKTKIQEATNLPSGKQKLVYDGLFVKDSQSLAYYNMLNGSMIQLQLKERGGRKK